MPLNIKHLSFSAIDKFKECPSAWAARYALGIEEKRGTEAQFGTHCEKLLAEKLGFPALEYEDEDGKRQKCTSGYYRKHFASDEIDVAIKSYAKQPWHWKEPVATQVYIEILPERWAEIAGKYSADPVLPIKIIGFVDFQRHTPESAGLPDNLRPLEIMDLKTIKRDQWKQSWATQSIIYAVALDAPRWSIHRFDRAKKQWAEKKVEMDTPQARALTKQVMDSTAYYARAIHQVVQNPGLVDHLPRSPGWLCDYCPLYDKCEAGKVFASDISTTKHSVKDNVRVGVSGVTIDDLTGSMGRKQP